DSDIYLLDWTHHRFLHGNVSQDGLTSIVTDTAYFSDGIAVNQNSFILKKLFANGTQYVLAKKILQPQELVIDRKLLTCQGEGLFSIDGMMRYAPSSSILCYIYYYRNEYFTIDTNLRQMMHGRTIDTNTIAKIKVSRINSQKVLTLSAPPLVVNRQACVDDGNLYICSNLKADNENGDAFERSSVIDVYNLNTATYRFSFYVRQPNGEKLKTFQVYRDTLYGIQGRSLISLPLRHLTP
ncbi:MAG TPA: hypothetical protein VNS32_03925, partial [Flavisolibacter sp.]|nr:hypothetical protein [Flavisolibacter sp.]